MIIEAIFQLYISNAHTVLAITTKSPEIKDLEILDFTVKINFLTFYTL